MYVSASRPYRTLICNLLPFLHAQEHCKDDATLGKTCISLFHQRCTCYAPGIPALASSCWERTTCSTHKQKNFNTSLINFFLLFFGQLLFYVFSDTNSILSHLCTEQTIWIPLKSFDLLKVQRSTVQSFVSIYSRYTTEGTLMHANSPKSEFRANLLNCCYGKDTDRRNMSSRLHIGLKLERK